MKEVLVATICAAIISFGSIIQDSNQKHEVVKNADMVISLRLDSLSSDGSIILYTSHTSIDTSSYLRRYLPIALKHMLINGTPTVTYFDGGKDTIDFKKLSKGKKI